MADKRDSFFDLAPLLVDIDVDEEGKREVIGRRMVFIDTNIFAKIIDNMEEVAGPVIERRVKEFGREAGLTIGENMRREFKDVSLQDVVKLLLGSHFKISELSSIKKTDTKSTIEKIMGYGSHAGWYGKGEIKDYMDKKSFAVEIENTFESQSYGETSRKECRFIEGTVEGVTMALWGNEDVKAEEVECASESREIDKCVFEVERDES